MVVQAYDMQGFEGHVPVLYREVLEHLQPQDGKTYLDGTFGAGGHSRAILEAANCNLIAIDQDPNTAARAKNLSADFPDRFTFLSGKYADMEQLCGEIGVTSIDGILLDIGVSSMQIDQADRGFSFQKDGPLDMRMSQNGTSAADWIASVDETTLADVIYQLGDERKSRRIAHAIVTARAIEPISRTLQLAEIIKKSVGRYNDTIHPATRSFQAIRIFINAEFEQLEQGLEAAENLLNVGGKMLIITFHSGEDIIVKRFMRQRSGDIPRGNRYLPEAQSAPPQATIKPTPRKTIAPRDDEVRANPRARSAKLRVAKKLEISTLEACES